MISLLPSPLGLGIAAGGAAGLFLLRQLLLILAAEQGRKHDLVKKRYKDHQEFQLSILIPFLDPNDYPALLALLRAIHEQDYPAAKVAVHLVTSEESQRDLIPQSLRPNVKTWQYPQPHPRYEQAMAWLIERRLAAGGNGLFVFLKPTDMIKGDYFQNVAARGLDSFAIQGYVALKNPPETPLAKAYALSTRLFNRIGNAGRYHLGMSCRLLDSGWAIKQEVLEMIPYQRGMDLDNLEYTIRLNLENFRVNWAPSVVVYSDSGVHFLSHVTRCVGAALNRLSLLLRYGPLLLTRLLTRPDLNYLEQLLATVSPPYFLTFLVLCALTALSAQTILPVPGTPVFWGGLALLTLSLHALGLVVARCKATEYAAMAFHTPAAYLFGLLATPLGLYGYVQQVLANRPAKGAQYRQSGKTRFNEALDTPPDLFDERHSRHVIQSILKKSAQETATFQSQPDFSGAASPESRVPVGVGLSLGQEGFQQEGAAGEAGLARRPRETVRAIPVSNGKKYLDCRLRTLTTFNTQDQESYCLTLEYKTVSFSTESYRILDQAFYELQTKLMGRGLSMISCGSCGHFYNPTADVPGALKNAGVCLFNKQGREVNLGTDAVTVVSQACEHHCDLEKRESIVRQWKDSLSQGQRLL